MAEDIYSNYSDTFIDQYTQKEHYSIIIPPTFSYTDAKWFTITPELEYRPDMISYIEYGTTKYEDYITYFNQMMDPIKDYYSGRRIFLPSINELQRVLGE